MAAKAAKPIRTNPVRKLTAAMIAVLAVLHETGKLHSPESLAEATSTTAKSVSGVLAKLKELDLVSVNDKGNWRFNGLRCKALSLLVGTLRMNGGTMTASEIGNALWADPKVAAKDPKAAVRYIAPAGAVLKTAFDIGVVYKVEQEGTVPKFGVVA